MKKQIRTLLCIILLTVSGVPPLEAQEEAPEDPGLILPSILLEIEDLRVEKIDAGLPEESDILLPSRELFLPEDVTLDIPEPRFSIDLESADLAPPGTDGSSAGGGTFGTPLIAEGMLGAGNVNSIISKISFYKPGDLPRYRFLFTHELYDGYSGRSTGIGFGSRLDELGAALLLNLGTAELDSTLSFTDDERGLQGQGAYFSVISRIIDSRNALRYKLSDVTTVSAGLDNDLTSLILTGGTAPPAYPGISYYPPTEMILAPYLKSDFNLNALTLGLSTTYKFRNVRGSGNYDFHRLFVTADLKIEFPFWLNMTGKVSYFFSNLQPLLFPFEIAFSGNPSSHFSFGLRGGYFLKENNFNNLLADYLYVEIPASLMDNHGWYGAATLNFNLFSGKLALLFDGLADWNTSFYYPSAATDSTTGLRSLDQVTGTLSSDVSGGLEWNITPEFALDFHYRNFSLWTGTTPLTENSLDLEGEYISREQTWGVSLGAALNTGTRIPQLSPELNLAGFVKATENIDLSLTVDDILQPLLGDRTLSGPFISPGIKGLFKIEINF